MRSHRCVLLLAGLVLAGASRARAQQLQPPPTAPSLRFESWQVVPPSLPLGAPVELRLHAAPAERTRHALLGGAIGAAAAMVACTVISTLADDSADGGISFCPLDTYLLIGGAGFIVGAVVGWVL
jgi:hypothetical protein